MWPQFALTVLFISAILFLPGWLFTVALFRRATVNSIAVAPPISVAFFVIAGLLVGAAGITGFVASIAVLFIPLAIPLLFLLIQAVAGKSRLSIRFQDSEISIPCIYVAVSVIVVGIFFIKSLDGPNALFQQSDNVHHLGLILEMAHDGNYSILQTSTYYLSDISSGTSPVNSIGFYPNGFFIPAALSVAILGNGAPMAENAALFVFAALVYPLTTYSLLKQLFSNKLELLSGALATAGFAAFPLALFVFGPLYPVMAGFCCVPSIVCTFITFFGDQDERLLQKVIFFVVCCIGAASLQPSSVLTAGVILIPFCLHTILSADRSRTPYVSKHRHVIAALFSAAVIALWLFLTYGPIMRSVTSFSWAALHNPVSGIYNVLTLSLRLGSPQYLLAALVVLGMATLVARHDNRWLVASFLFVCALYYVGDVTDTELKQLFTGFWYTDQWRTAANIAIVGVPIAAVGIARVLSFFNSWDRSRVSLISLPACIVGAIICLIIFQPQQYLIPNGANSAFGAISDTLQSSYVLGEMEETSNIYTSEEQEFSKKAASVIPEGCTVLNMPFDGSVFAYLDGTLNTYYKSYPSADSETSSLIRLSLNELDRNREVQEAVLSTGASYIILLEKNGFEDQGDGQWSLCGSYGKSSWTGFSENLDDLESVELVLSEGNMRLYRIRVEELYSSISE